MVTSHHVKPKGFKEDIFRKIKSLIHYVQTIKMCYAPNLKLFLKKVSAPLLPQPMSIKNLDAPQPFNFSKR